MAYLESKPGNRRAVAITVVALLHAAAFYGLITGLGVTYIKEVMPVFKARNIPIDQPKPPPEPQPSATPDTRNIETRQPDISDRVLVPSDTIFVPMPPAPDTVELDIPRPPAPPPPGPRFTPRAANPSNGPVGWVSTNDYPSRDLREGNQGLVRYSLTIGADGKVEACTVTQSSGFRGLDEATCKHVSRRARFRPATDGNGEKVTGSYAGSVRWVIPEG
ncbi:MAG: energy transducer TonB [Novosphingobium sp.]